MTDRQIGGADANVDLRSSQPQIDAALLNVDIQPVLAMERQLDSAVLR